MRVPELDPEALARLEALFHAAFEQPAGHRAAWLRRACGDDEALFATLLEMVGHAEREETDLARSIGRFAGEAAEPRDRSGENVGRYELQERIRWGGMAEVYRARRADGEFRHDVALKIVRRDRLPASLAPLFQRERELLARLRHPHICQIFDGGTTEAGEPYFVMERLEGETFLDACRRPELGWRRGLGLFLDLCSAVSYAHGQLVVHRDIKADNVLVEAGAEGPEARAPLVKLLDFGIAAALADAAEPTDREVWFSPTTTAPEVIAGERGGVAADIFSLGVLLAGIADLFPGERREEVGRIAAFASQADPASRYPSVEALAADLRRMRERRPISLLTGRPAYVARLFVRRHALAIAALATVPIGGTLLLAREIQLRKEAQAERDKARATRDFLVEAYASADPALNEGNELKVYELLDRQLAALERDRSLAGEVRGDLLHTLGTTLLSLGRHEEADRALHRALAELGESDNAGSPLWAHLTVSLAQSARRAERVDEAETLLREVEARRQTWLGSEEGDSIAQKLHSTLAALAQGRNQLDEAEQQIRKALEIQARLDSGGRERANLLVTLGSIDSARGRLRPALESFREAHHLLEAAPRPAGPELLGALGWLGITSDRLGEPEAAERYLKQAIPLAESLYPTANRKLSGVYNNLGTMYLTNGRLAEAEPLLRKALAIHDTLGDTSSLLYHTRLANLGRLFFEREDFAAARPLVEAALAARLGQLGPTHPSVAASFGQLSQLELAEGRAEAALQAALRARRILEGPKAAADINLPSIVLAAARARLALGQGAEALDLAEEARAILAAHHVGNDRLLAPARGQNGEILRRLGRSDEARAAFDEALAAYGRSVSANHPGRARCQLRLAELAADTAELDAARRNLDQARPTLERELVAGAPTRLELAALSRRLEATPPVPR